MKLSCRPGWSGFSPDRLGHAWYTRSLAGPNTIEARRDEFIANVPLIGTPQPPPGRLCVITECKDERSREWVTDLVNGPIRIR